MSDDVQKAMMGATDSNAVFSDALARIKQIPAGKTLIDSISDAEWCDSAVADWHISAGSDATGDSDELDGSDKEHILVA